ncbi:Uncharacterized protein SVXHr_1284 [Halorhabdus sp. SVX81]|uniref:DUF2309 domain-containing protein n=1 Tax=Halorhabdus sp. SVX81 TaxID=2978283 RepID=UPI0023DC39E5|nr:DUF2309 domain-containing protein [Halorhabdus sp. SVX81]WEL17455.1 Uncharacterized protein SVXHr_1284 [Halorhabdus sp. SVX81]
MSSDTTIEDSIDKAASTVGSAWPIHSFVTANPLSGFEDVPFEEAVRQARDLLGGRGYPSPETFRSALADGRIDREVLAAELADRGYDAEPERLLAQLDVDAESDTVKTDRDRVDHVLTKWLSAFLDTGQATWSMPNREDGFYAAFRQMADHDGQIPERGVVTDLPSDPINTVETVMESSPESQWVPILEEQLAALPGWTGFIKQRARDGSAWQSKAPITLTGYLAARFALLEAFDVDIHPQNSATTRTETATDIAPAFLTAWERSYRNELLDRVVAESESVAESEPAGRPDAQLVFCIDTRSEVIRRHVEATGNYETHGYAGFFGVPMEYQAYDAEVSVDAAPPIVDPEHRITEMPTGEDARTSHDRWSAIREAAGEAIETLTANPATAFGFVEQSGGGYGLALAARTLLPRHLQGLFDAADDMIPDAHEFSEPLLDHQHTYAGDLPVGLTHEEQVEYAETAFELMGIEAFGRLVVFVGHASETTNNPFDSSLDCGACAGNPGGPNARVLAAICNDSAVRTALADRGIDIPGDTVFLAGEHNTTTDEVELFDDEVPETHTADLEKLRADLSVARENAASERAAAMRTDDSAGVREIERRAGDWAETRPEWGLAGNAGFVIGPRELTSDLDLDGRAFLHSYDYTTDPDGDALASIFTGPLVVTQWINAQYYFSTVDTAVYGSGSKITQNPVGNVGVYQGNGGDLLTGLPLQSLKASVDQPYHQPLRLSVAVHAPVERVTDVLANNPTVTELLDNDWLSLSVVDPTQDHRRFHYEANLEWRAVSDRAEPTPETPNAPAVADD